LDTRTTVIASSSWPTPTAKANHFAPYMRRWPAYARLQDEMGRVPGHHVPRLWLALMGFPLDWLDCLAMPLFLMSPSTSDAESNK